MEKYMKKILFSILMTMALTFTIKCNSNAMGVFYTNATYPVTATGTKVASPSDLKKGSSSTTNVLFLVEVGDASIDEAAKKAGIKKYHILIWMKRVYSSFGGNLL